MLPVHPPRTVCFSSRSPEDDLVVADSCQIRRHLRERHPCGRV